MTMTRDELKAKILESVQELIAEYRNDPTVRRDDVIERLDEESDSLWGQLVFQGMLTNYDVDDLIRALPVATEIIKLAQDEAWVENDSGLWEGLTYGVVPSIAYFSLRNLMVKYLEDAGHDINQEHPFAKDHEDVEAGLSGQPEE